MSLHRRRLALETYLAEVTRLRRLTFDELTEEIDRLDPLWVTLKVVPEMQKSASISVDQNSYIGPIALRALAGTVHVTYPRRTP